MGWANIHLDMMTITIAAITMGIAVDDTIHYIHRFEQEFNRSGNYLQAMFKCGETIAYAMFYTSLVITVGFSILVFSNFIPTIYFGLLTGLAMIVALIANITLLPALIIIFKPYGKEK
jgi:predicted RND superfamily exporter protein